MPVGIRAVGIMQHNLLPCNDSMTSWRSLNVLSTSTLWRWSAVYTERVVYDAKRLSTEVIGDLDRVSK